MKAYSGNHSFLKEFNTITVLRLIQEKNLISRAALADLLGLNRSTLTAITNELLKQQLVKEVGNGASRGGRPPTLLQFNSDAAYSVSIEWSYQDVKIYINNLSGNVYFSHVFLHKDDDSISAQIHEVINIISAAIPELPSKPLGLLGIGIIVPGIVDKGMVSSYSMRWESVPMLNYFAEAFKCPIIINNDAHAGIIAESYFGCAKGHQNVCYIKVGRSLSAGLILNGQIFLGSEGFTGRIGHNTLDANGRKCVCGNKGCWEAYVSERALIQRYSELSSARGAAGEIAEGAAEDITLESIVAAAHKSDPRAIGAIHDLSEYLGLGIANIVNLLNPKLIVIGNMLGDIDGLMLPTLHSVLRQKALPHLRRNIQIVFSGLSERSLRLGATALVLDDIFSTPYIKARDVT